MKAAFAAALVLFAAGSASAGCVVERLAELPVTMSGLQPYVHAKINGAEIRLLADSGAFFSMISPGTARELKLSTTPAPYWFSIKGIGGLTEASFTKVKDFTLDQIPLHNIDFLVGGSEIGQTLGGVMGRNILGLADVEYDLANGSIRLMRPSGCGDRPLAYWSAGKSFSSLDMLPDASRNPATTVNVTVNGVRLRATLDSGASTSLLFLGAAKRVGVAVSNSSATEKGTSSGIGRRMVTGYTAPLTDLKIGDEEIKTTRIRVLETGLENVDVLLGADFFLSHRIYVSNARKKVYFTYNGGPVFSLVATAPDTSATPLAPAGPGTVADSKAPTADPTDATGFSRRGQAFAARRDFARALPDLDRAVALAPENADYVYQRGMARWASGQVFLAMTDIEQSLKLRPNDTAALLTRAELRFMGHDPAGAISDLKEIDKLAPAAGDVRLALAGLHGGAGRMDDAMTQFTLWIAAHPDDSRRPQALNGRCWARTLLNRDLDKALADCNGAVRADPKSYAFLDSRGLVLLRLGQFDKSIADYDASLAIQPKSAWSLYGRGLAKLKTGDAAGGKADLAAAVAINPKMPEQAAKYGVSPPPAP